MEELTDLIVAITNLLDSLSRFVEQHGAVVLFGVLGFGFAFYVVYTVQRLGMNLYKAEIERIVASRNKVHEALLEKRESSKKEGGENDRD